MDQIQSNLRRKLENFINYKQVLRNIYVSYQKYVNGKEIVIVRIVWDLDSENEVYRYKLPV